MDASEKALIRNLQTHDLAEHLRLRRARLAREAGLPVEDFAQPFPGRHTTTIVRTEGPGLWTWLFLAAAALGLFGSTLPWLPRPAPAKPEPVELRVQWWVEETAGKE